MDDIEEELDTPTRRVKPWWMRLSVWAAVIFVGGITIHLVFKIPSGTVFGSLILGALILRVGFFFLQQFATPPPAPPDPGTLRKVKLLFRCSVCGTEVRMTAANNEDPEPPRHCMDDMELVAPTME
ncbi:MAG: hypothetical protein WD029_05270 [Microthrixaceae bacterium]